MIWIHCNDKWIDHLVPRKFKIRPGVLTDSSSGTIGAFCSYDGATTMGQIQSLSARYQHVLIYYCEPFNSKLYQERILLKALRESPENVMFFSDVLFDHNPHNHIYVGNWWMVHSNLYSECCWAPDLMSELYHDVTEKPYCFDALLGTRRPNRDLIHGSWNTSRFQDRILLTYHGTDARRGIWHMPFCAESCENVPLTDPNQLRVTLWTPMPLPSGEVGHQVGTQNIIPTKIYNDTWYSIIAEGFFDPRGTRLTEKTAKALVAERLFVYFGGPRDLERMRRLGFQTFSAVIDESYDTIQDDQQRWQAAWQQVEWLCTQDPVAVLKSTEAERANNKRVFLETDWYIGLSNHIKSICAKY